MLRDQYQYAIELKCRGRRTLPQVPVSMDWGPAIEWARFLTLRQNPAEMKPFSGDATIEPEWDSTLGEPFVDGVRVSLDSNGSSVLPVRLPLAIFNRTAMAVSKGLVAKELLEPNEEFLYTVVAFPAARREPPRTGLSLTVQEIAASYALKKASRGSLLSSAKALGVVRDEDVLVFMPKSVLEEAGALTRAASATEAAGILIGHVCRDPEDIFVQVSALIPAKHTRAGSTQVTFTPDTWTAVDAAIQLRRAGEMMIGWFHSHPAKYWCSANCAPETRRTCPLGRSFFSGDDCALHRTVFPTAHCVALLVTNAETGLRHALFGWRQGLIVQRGFHVLNADPGLMETESSEAVIGEDHEEACA
jgi:proteasome lid subunit RPN8/RPN11